MYNLWIFLIILAILSAFNAQNKAEILKDKNLSVTDDIFYTSLFIVIILGVIKYTEKTSFIPGRKSSAIRDNTQQEMSMKKSRIDVLTDSHLNRERNNV